MTRISAFSKSFFLVAPGGVIVASLIFYRQFFFWIILGGAFILAALGGIIYRSHRRPMTLTARLRIAVKEREFKVVYQPIINLTTGDCVGAEALVRWSAGSEISIDPDQFIPVAEESGLITAITDQVIDTVFEDFGEKLSLDRNLHISINISAEDISSGRILPVIERKMKEANVLAQQIWLEATERISIDIDASRSTLAHARSLGYVIAIDDFGTGYSSLQYLQNLPLDVLKIDRSFIKAIGSGMACGPVISCIISMAKGLRLAIVAEGVETSEQANYLHREGVQFAQGWFFSPPLPPTEFFQYYTENS